MKNIIKISLCFVALALSFSCKKDYMETAPESSVAPANIFSTTENAVLAVNGICKMMTTQYLSTQGLNGEGTIKTWYGNHGNDLQRVNHSGWASFWNHTLHESVNSTYLVYPWYYYYKIIGNANQIIENIDGASGPEVERQFIKAQALTFRAHAYTMLMQLYAYRWADSNNGSSNGVVLRLDTGTEELPLSTQAECYTQIYKDLDDAIELFKASGLDRGSDEFYKPNINVAYAVKTRAALVREDWNTAAACAPEARKGHPLMSKSQYIDGGFSDENDEWIWGVYEAMDQTIYYYSFFAYQASNASSSMQKSRPLAISKELYDQIPATDARRELWLEPTDAEWAACDATDKAGSAFSKRAKAAYASKLNSASTIYAYMTFKFLCTFTPGGGSFNIYRSAEMYLAEAEALCHIGGQDAKVQSLMKELNKNLDPNYDCTKTGAALLDEVKLYRRIDLWGEGFDWYDYKRWNQPIVRKSKDQGGNFQAAYAVTINPADGNKWTWKIPKNETDYNKLISLD